MTSTKEQFNNDLSYLVGLAEAGRRAPLQTGPYLVAGGAWFGGASALLALAQLGILSLADAAVLWIWVAAAIGFGITLFTLIRRDGSQGEPGYNRLINAAWSGAGFGIFAFWAASMLMAMQLGNESVLYTISLAVLVIYGIVWWTSGSLTGVPWMRGIALISFASTLPVAVAVGTQFVWLAYTLALVASSLLPGLYLLRIGGRAA